MLKKIQKQIYQNESILFDVGKKNYVNSFYEIIKQLHKNSNHICIVNLNKFAQEILIHMLEKKIDFHKFVFIDGISKAFDISSKDNNIAYLKNSTNLIELNTEIAKKCLKNNLDFVLIDSLNELKLFNDISKVEKFNNFLKEKLGSLDIKFGQIYVEDDMTKKDFKLISKNFDKIIKIR